MLAGPTKSAIREIRDQEAWMENTSTVLQALELLKCVCHGPRVTAAAAAAVLGPSLSDPIPWRIQLPRARPPLPYHVRALNEQGWEKRSKGSDDY